MPDARPPAVWSPVWDALPEEHQAPYPLPPGTRYLLPCPVLFFGGLYEYVLVDVPYARGWMLRGPVTSFLANPFLHKGFEWLMGFFTPRAQKGPLPQLSYHDEALIFSLDGYEMLPSLASGDSKKVQLAVEEERYTIGLLRRLA